MAFRRLAKNSAIYGRADLATKHYLFLLLPSSRQLFHPRLSLRWN